MNGQKKEMMKKKNETVGISIRIDIVKNRKFSAILALKGMTATGFFQNAIDCFIRDNYKEARELLNLDEIAGEKQNEG